VRIKVKHIRQRHVEENLAELLISLARTRVNVLVSSGSFEDDVRLMRAVVDSGINIPVLACVAAGVRGFQHRLGSDADGVIGPSQWEEQIEVVPELGPRPARFAKDFHAGNPGLDCDYPAAQIYAAGLLTVAALHAAGSIEPRVLRSAFGDLRTSTLFGEFALDRVTGRQIGHKMLLVQWHENQKVVIHPDAHADLGTLELPSGWRLILTSFKNLRMTSGPRRPRSASTTGDSDEEN
jgi:branched-chain amino acid transport system substrate-binding protein